MILYICCMLCDYKFLCYCVVFFFKQKTAYEMRISDWSSDVCSSDLPTAATLAPGHGAEFMPALAELLPGLVVEFGGEGAAADARRIGLGDAEHEADRRGAEARARRGGAADGVRAGDEGIGAVIDVEQYALRALEQYAGAGLAHLLQPLPHRLDRKST